MSDRPTKIPLPLITIIAAQKDEKMTSGDSDEGIASTIYLPSTGTQSSNGKSSLVAKFDDLMSLYRSLTSSQLEAEFYLVDFVEQVQLLHLEHLNECNTLQELQDLAESTTQNCTDLTHMLNKARKFLDVEIKNASEARKERDDLATQINMVKKFFFKHHATSREISLDEMRRKLPFLFDNKPSDGDVSSNNGHPSQLTTVNKINSTGSIFSDFSYSRSEDELDSSSLAAGRAWKKHRPSTGGVAGPALKK